MMDCDGDRICYVKFPQRFEGIDPSDRYANHNTAVLKGLLKVIAGIEISFTLTSKSSGDEESEDYVDLCIIKWSSLMILPVIITMVNLMAIGIAVCRTIYSDNHQ